jgi:hypothetical protein
VDWSGCRRCSFLLAQGRYGAAILLVVIGPASRATSTTFIRPLIYKKVSNTHPMITLVGAFAGVRYFGLLGILLGPLAIAYLFELLGFSERSTVPPPKLRRTRIHRPRTSRLADSETPPASRAPTFWTQIPQITQKDAALRLEK